MPAGHNLGNHLRGPQVRAQLQTLGQAHHQSRRRRPKPRLHARARLAERLRRTGQQHQIRARQSRGQVLLNGERRRQRHPREIVGVLPGDCHRLRLRGAARDQRDRLARPGQMDRKRRAPGSRPDDREFHGGANSVRRWTQQARAEMRVGRTGGEVMVGRRGRKRRRRRYHVRRLSGTADGSMGTFELRRANQGNQRGNRR
jgi:hypothetical protein